MGFLGQVGPKFRLDNYRETEDFLRTIYGNTNVNNKNHHCGMQNNI